MRDGAVKISNFAGVFKKHILQKNELMEESKVNRLNEHPSVVKEPSVACGVDRDQATAYLQGISDGTMQQLIHVALDDLKRGHCMSQNDLEMAIKSSMGW